ncbi:MAG: spore cortex biosynthesis protein YabQ [Clostridia bacterium]|nr:spore cortex biosynthesis protein YabQ [Clostridia bacterium]
MLLTEVSQQLLFCLRFGLLGLLLGVVYDALRAMRMYHRMGRLGTGLLDVLFCFMGLLGFLLLMLRGTDGRLRLYLPLGLAGGFALYRSTVSVYLLRLFLWALRLFGRAASAAKEILLWNFGFPRGN